ncbi:MAG: hypothetical protein ACOYME_00010 [Prochlorotrichaceae cyanobacterium]|jgi:hypothetical protein
MPPSLVRQVWTRVEETQANLLLQLDDASLARHLVGKLEPVDGQEAHLVHHYINAKLPLIRDLAQSRLVGSF